MAGRGRTSSQKRRKEQNRLEKRQVKAERKQKLKTDKEAGIETQDDELLLGPFPIEFDPDLDRGLTPELQAELNVVNRSSHD